MSKSSNAHLNDLDRADRLELRVAELEEEKRGLLEACKMAHDKLDYLQNLWGKEGVTQRVASTLQQAIESVSP